MKRPRPARLPVVRCLVVVTTACALNACQGDGARPVPHDTIRDSVPLVGGACTYAPVAFRGIVDSVAPDGRVLVQVLDSVPGNLSLCLRSEDALWWVPSPRQEQGVSHGDTIEVSGEVIATGTCTPCSLSSRRSPQR